MENISIKEVLDATNGKLISGDTNCTINFVCIDSREIIKNNSKNCLFVPLKGEHTDGHNFIKNSFESGAKASFIEKNCENYQEIISINNGILIEVDNTLCALQDLAKYYRSKFNIPVIGVTGSVGKTTTKEMLACVLSENLKVFKSQGNYNGQIGLPLSIFNLDSTHQVAVLEMGVSKFGEMDKLYQIAKPNIGVITNIGVSHLENFKNIKNTCQEKIKIVQDNNSKLYVNGDIPVLSNINKLNNFNQNINIIKFGINGNYNFTCQEIISECNQTSFVLSTPEFKENIIIPCLGIHNVYNSLATICVALDLNMHIEDIKSGLLKFKNSSMRQEILNLNNIILIDDSYNSSPDSLKSSVSIIKNIKSTNKIILILGDMLELGEESENLHFETGKYIASENKNINILITVGENSKYLSDGAKNINPNLTCFHCKDNKEIIKILQENNILNNNNTNLKNINPDVFLVKGSRSMHLDEITNFIKKYENKL